MQVDERKLFVCRLPSDIKCEEVKQIFETYGPVIQVDIMDTADTPNERLITLRKQENYWIGMDEAGEETLRVEAAGIHSAWDLQVAIADIWKSLPGFLECTAEGRVLDAAAGEPLGEIDFVTVKEEQMQLFEVLTEAEQQQAVQLGAEPVGMHESLLNFEQLVLQSISKEHFKAFQEHPQDQIRLDEDYPARPYGKQGPFVYIKPKHAICVTQYITLRSI